MYLSSSDEWKLPIWAVLSESNMKTTAVIDNRIILNEILKDGREIVSVVQDGDVFDKERGVQECIMQYIFGDKSYHTYIRSLIKADEKLQNDKEKKLAEEKAAKEAQIKKEKENRDKRIARERARKEYEIEIQKEAYLRAMREMDKGNEDC